MSGEAIGWDKPQRVTIGVPSRIVSGIMDEWLYRAAPVAMTVRRAKTKGLILLIMELGKEDARGMIFASWCIQQAQGAAKVDIKPL